MPQFTINWTWDEAFNKFGFDDGDGVILTGVVEEFLYNNGYIAESDSWGMHNTTIMFLSAPDGTPIITAGEVDGQPHTEYGYDCPSKYLPENLVTLLNEKFGAVSGMMGTPSMPEEA